MSFTGEYRYSASHRWGSILCTLFFVAWWGFILWTYFAGFDASMRRIGASGLLMLISVPFGMTILCLFLVNQMFGAVVVDADGIEVRGLVGSKRGEFHEFDRLEPLRNKSEGFILWPREGAPFKVGTTGLVNAKDLHDYVKSRIVPGPRVAVDETEFRLLFPKAILVAFAAIAVGLVAFPWFIYGTRSGSLPMHAIYDLFALLMVAATVQIATTRIQLFPDRVEKRNAFGKQAVRFADVKKLELEIMTSRGGSVEVLRLIHAGRDFTLSPQFSHFTQLRDAIVTRCAHTKIQDSRPAEYR